MGEDKVSVPTTVFTPNTIVPNTIVPNTPAMTLDASGHLGLGVAAGSFNPRLSVGKSTLTEAMTWLVNHIDPHPALRDEVVEHLLEMSHSTNADNRCTALCHKWFPLARVVTMCNDPIPHVRELAQKIVQYEQQNIQQE